MYVCSDDPRFAIRSLLNNSGVSDGQRARQLRGAGEKPGALTKNDLLTRSIPTGAKRRLA